MKVNEAGRIEISVKQKLYQFRNRIFKNMLLHMKLLGLFRRSRLAFEIAEINVPEATKI